MSAGFDLAQEAAASLSSRQGAWRFIRRFAASWLTPLTDDDGWTEADLQAAEQRLGVRLPAAMREAYTCSGAAMISPASRTSSLTPMSWRSI